MTLGFGFKSYVGYRMRQRRQKVENYIHDVKHLQTVGQKKTLEIEASFLWISLK